MTDDDFKALLGQADPQLLAAFAAACYRRGGADAGIGRGWPAGPALAAFLRTMAVADRCARLGGRRSACDDYALLPGVEPWPEETI